MVVWYIKKIVYIKNMPDLILKWSMANYWIYSNLSRKFFSYVNATENHVQLKIERKKNYWRGEIEFKPFVYWKVLCNLKLFNAGKIN